MDKKWYIKSDQICPTEQNISIAVAKETSVDKWLFVQFITAVRQIKASSRVAEDNISNYDHHRQHSAYWMRRRELYLTLTSSTVRGLTSIRRNDLHWLDVPERVTFRLCVMVYKCLHDMAPPYLSELCRQTRNLRAPSTALSDSRWSRRPKMLTIYIRQTGLLLRWPSSMELFTWSFKEQYNCRTI